MQYALIWPLLLRVSKVYTLSQYLVCVSTSQLAFDASRTHPNATAPLLQACQNVLNFGVKLETNI